MKTFNLKITVLLKQDLKNDETYEKISNFIAYAMLKDETLKTMHEENTYKNYVFCSLYPVQKDGIYKQNEIYSFDLRSSDFSKIMKLKQVLNGFEDNYFKIIRINLQNHDQIKINKLVTLTPAVITTQKGDYDIKDDMDLVKTRILANMQKKYKNIYGTEINVDFIKQIKKTNKKPIKIPYKNISLLGNKFEIEVKEDPMSQNLAYLAVSIGILEKNSLRMRILLGKIGGETMTYDLLEVFKQYFQNTKVVLDSYTLTDGYYYVVDENNNFEKLQIVNGQSENYDLEKYIKVRDFYSKYINSNKAVDTSYKEAVKGKEYSTYKKICSNNIYTLFFKNKFIQGLLKKEDNKDEIPVEIFKKGIIKYYDSLLKIGNNPKEQILLKEKYTKEEIENYKAKMLKAFEIVYEDLKNEDMQKESWIKIFLKIDEEEYKRVSEIYLKTKLFNTNDSNVEVEGKTYGANNYNYGLNSKKPYLELKSTNFKVGSYVSNEDISALNNLYIWMYNNAAGKTILKLPLDWQFNGIPKDEEDIQDKATYIVKVVGNNGNARIDDFRYASNYNTKIRKFICKNYLEKEPKIVFETENVYALNWYTNNIWFAENEKSTKNYIRDSYYDYDLKISKSILANWKKDILKQNSNLFLELFEQEEWRNFVDKLDDIAIQIIEKMFIDNLKQNKNYTNNPKKAFNLWIAYKQYFRKKGEDEEMKINNLQEQCEKIVNTVGKIETDEQYYYLAGQVAYYLLTRSKADKLMQDVTEPFTRANTPQKLKKELEFLYEKYKYDIYLKYPKFNNIMSQLLLQEPEDTVKNNKELLLAGLLAQNVFYNSQEKINDGGKENE